jgi:integrase
MLKSGCDLGHDIEGSKITLGEYLTQWLETSNIDLRSSTKYQYGLTIKNHILPYIGDIRLKDLNLARIERHYAELGKANLSPRTIKLVHAVLHKSLKKAVKYGQIHKNPASGAALPRYRQSEMKVLDANQLTQFLITAQGSYYEALYHLAIHTGMRQGELFGLKWTDLRWQSSVLHVQRQARRVPGRKWEFLEPKTSAGRRMITLGQGVLRVMQQHKARLTIHKAVAGDRWGEHDLIFPNRVGNPGDPSNLRKDFLTLLVKAGLPIIRFHDLRHTAASLMLNNGIPTIVVSKRLGHAKPSTTLDIYGHLYHEKQEEAARLMDELVTPIPVDMIGIEQKQVVVGEK